MQKSLSDAWITSNQKRKGPEIAEKQAPKENCIDHKNPEPDQQNGEEKKVKNQIKRKRN